jgi:hypothetical protein
VTAQPRYRPVLPSAAPTPADLAERDRFQELARDSLRSVRASAEAWRNGLAAFITLVTAGIVIKGRDTVATLPTGWRLATTVLVVSGLVFAVVGLWQVLTAQAGIPVALTLKDIHARFGSLQALEVATAVRDGRRLDLARYWVGASLVLLLAGVGLTWWAPTKPADPPTYLRVDHGRETTCGILKSADEGRLRIAVPGRHEPAVIPLADASTLSVVATCPDR